MTLNRQIYKKLAKKYGVSVNEVKRDMQAYVDTACKNPTPLAVNIKKENATPTVDEFINLVVGKVKREIQEENNALEAGIPNSFIDDPLKKMIMDLWVRVGNTIFKEQELLSEFKNKDQDKLHEYHFRLGMFLRNNVLTEDSELYKKFQAIGVKERDDMSSIIIQLWHTALQQE